MSLELPHDVTGNAARVLNVFLPIKDLPDCFWFRTHGVPKMHGEDQRIAPWFIVKDALRRCVRENTAVPVELSINAYCRKSWRQGAGGHDMARTQFNLLCIKVAHHARANMGGPQGQPWVTAVDQREVHEFFERAPQRLC